jgi:GAF domain-containing protein
MQLSRCIAKTRLAMTTREELVSDTFLRLADTLVDDFDVIDLLTTLAARCVELLAAAEAGIMVVNRQGALQVVAASSENAKLLELFQIQNSEGPCLDAYRTGEAVIHEDLTAGSPWPRFAALAISGGLASVYAFPMRLRANVLGTLNLFMTSVGPLSPADVGLAQALAHAATIALLQNQVTRDAHQLAVQLQAALNSRITIEQAKGFVAESSGIGMDEAFARLRSYARDHNLKLTDVAARVANRTLPSGSIASRRGAR